ncbi:MAG: hypothetical protein V4691_04365, partial [Pseudomonadota bacterium]
MAPSSKDSSSHDTEPFKRAVSISLRAIARDPKVDVSFTADKPYLTKDMARLPEPPRKFTAQDAAVLRGLADSFALKIALHDDETHRAQLPEGPNARAVFEAAEQARVESIGSKRMAGTAENITAMLEDHYYRGQYHEITDIADAPLADAVALLVREKLTGRAPPPAGKKIVDLWRPLIEKKAGLLPLHNVGRELQPVLQKMNRLLRRRANQRAAFAATFFPPF